MTDSVCGIVLGYGSQSDVSRALSSLQSSIRDGTIVLIQNGLSDSEIGELAARFPAVHVIFNSTNLGAAGGRNLGIKHALAVNAGYVFFLDRDATLEADAIERLLAESKRLPDAGLLGCLVMAADRPNQVHSAGASFDASSLQEIHYRQVPDEPVTVVDFVITTAALIRIEAVKQVGLLDERFFAYFEDLDWAQRLRALGLRHYIIKTAVAYHNEERSRFHPLVIYYLTRNRFLYAQSHGVVRGIRDPKIWSCLSRLTVGSLRQIVALRPLALTCFFAHGVGFADFVRGRFGRGPAWLEKSANQYVEWILRERLLKTRVYRLARHMKKHLMTKQK